MINTEAQDIDDELSADAPDIRGVFVSRVHQVLQEGYSRLNAKSHQATAEPAITGELVRSMKSYLRDLSSPEWADHFSVHDDPPVNDDIRFGKDRHRIDIRVDGAKPRPGASFAFEAKRLATGFPVAKYVGDQGLGCIIRGDYARDENDAGMIGYVQEKDANHWAGEIQSAIKADQGKFQVSESGWWASHSFSNGPAHLFRSIHSRATVGREVTIYHSLLFFG